MNGLNSAVLILGFLALALLVAGWLLLRRARKMRQTSSLPVGRIVYADTGDWRPPDKALFSNTHRLTGKPDYLVETRAGIIPVELKSGRTPQQPYPSHILQLAAYCLLVEETQGRRPPYGLIRYNDDLFRIDYTPALRQELISTLDNMRADIRSGKQGQINRSHQEPARCAGCGHRQDCDQALY